MSGWSSAPPDALWRERAAEAWQALQSAALVDRRGRVVVREPGRLRAVPLWPFSQVLHAAALVGASEAGRLRDGLEAYRRGAAYAERPGTRRRYYDDDAWVALALLDQGDVDTAARVLGFLREGCVALADGATGVRWVEGGTSLHACSTGSTGLVALRLAHREPRRAETLHGLARGATAFLETLLDDDGLVRDHRRSDGTVDAAVFTYNQGLLVGLLTGLGRLDDAVQLAGRVTAAFDPERLWRHPAAFDAILVRELLVLHPQRPGAGLRAWCAAYLDRVWHEARDAGSGLFRLGGLGRYDDGVVLDHAALTGAMARLAATR